MSYENGFVNIARHREICVAHMTCKGAAHAVYDARVVAKQICCDPRHPSAAPRQARAVTKIPHHPQLARTGTPRTRRGRNPGRTRGCLRLLRLLRHPRLLRRLRRLRLLCRLLAAPGVRLRPTRAILRARPRSASALAAPPPPPPRTRADRARRRQSVRDSRGDETVGVGRFNRWRSFFAATRRLESTRRSVEEVLRNDVGARDGVFVTHGSYAKPGAIDALRAANRVDRLLNLARGVGRGRRRGGRPSLASAEIPP